MVDRLNQTTMLVSSAFCLVVACGGDVTRLGQVAREALRPEERAEARPEAAVVPGAEESAARGDRWRELLTLAGLRPSPTG